MGHILFQDIKELEIIATQYLKEKNLTFPNYSFKIFNENPGIRIGGFSEAVAFTYNMAKNRIDIYDVKRSGFISYLMALILVLVDGILMH